MELVQLFPKNDSCLISDVPSKRTKTWRILNVDPYDTNRLRVWLLDQLYSMAINLVVFHENDTVFADEYLAHRIGLISISADPLDFEDLDPEGNCDENTCIQFDLNVVNSSAQDLNVTDSDLRWVPLGNQETTLRGKFPKPTYGNLLITVLAPGQALSFSAYAIKGNGQQHMKFSTVFPISAPFILAQTRQIPSVKIEQNLDPVVQTELMNPNCPPCSQVAKTEGQKNGFSCVNFTIQLQGGLTWENIFDQLQQLFDWGNSPPRNTLEQPKVPYIQL